MEIPSRNDLQQKIEEFNNFYKGKKQNQITLEEKNGEIKVHGPLRIYWGVRNPIRLKECDDQPTPPVATWRHSLYYPKESPVKTNKPLTPLSIPPKLPQSPNTSRGIDDNFISSDVVIRRKDIGKTNTVAYRGDRPNKWKRASINGHIYNFDTSIFTPVLGSCTSVTIANDMITLDVIKTLLDKFKVENQAEEYVLAVVKDSGEETLLRDGDYPLLDRIILGPDEVQAKIFIKERVQEVKVVNMPIIEERENLPEEVEQLLILPEAALKGILTKFENDEEKDISRIKLKYKRAREIILKRMQANQSA